MLDELFLNPGRDLISSAGHDEYYLDVNESTLEKLTDEQIIELTRCGIQYDSEVESLYSFT